MLDNVSGARARAEKGELAFGTVDTYLLWRLTNGHVHATDATNASRTLLFNIRSGAWDEELLRLFEVPPSLLPEVRDTAGEFGTAAAEHLGNGTAILAVAGDQQAALVGQACLQPGMVKATYGTGGFILLNTGPTPVRSRHRLVTTIAYQWQARGTTLWKDRSSSSARRSNGCATRSASSPRRPTRANSQRRPILSSRSISCRRFPVSARRTGTPARVAPSPA